MAALTRALAGSIVSVCCFACPTRATAQEPSPWSTTVSTERAAVSIGAARTVWETTHAQLFWQRPEVGGALVAVDRFKRGSATDVAISGTAYKRAGDWTVVGSGGGTIAPEFVYRGFIDGELSRRVAGTVVAGIGYRFLRYRTADVHQAQPSLTWYHPFGDVGVRMISTRNATTHRTTRAISIRATHDVTPRVRLSGGGASGTRIFDIASLPSDIARARVLYGGLRLGLTSRDFLELGGSRATEGTNFTFRAMTVGYRRVF